MTILTKTASLFFGIVFFISISVLGQGTGTITTASKNRELTATRISVLIQKKNWDKVRDYGDAAVVPLIKALKDNDKEIRIGAAEALGPLGDLRAVEPLSECLKDKDWNVRSQSAGSLGKLGEKTVADSLVGCLNDPSKEVRLEVVKALKNLADEEAFNPLVKFLKDPDPLVRSETIKALLVTGGDLAVDPFLEHLKEPGFNSKVEVIKALGVIRNKRAVESLAICLKDDNPSIRIWSMEALGRIGDSRAVEPLKMCLDDPQENVRDKAVNVLRKFQVIVDIKEAPRPVEVTTPKIDKKIETAAIPVPAAPQISVPDIKSPVVKPQELPIEKIKETRKAGEKIQPAKTIKKDSSSWWIYATIGVGAMFFVLLGMMVAASLKGSDGIRRKLDDLASKIREISREKTNDLNRDATLSLLEAHSEALIHISLTGESAEKKRKNLKIICDSMEQVSKVFGASHSGVKLLKRMICLIKENIERKDKQSERKDSSELPTFNSVKFKTNEIKDNVIYDIYTAGSHNDAIEFLRVMPVKGESKYVMVNTPDGIFGKNMIAIFNEETKDVMEYGQRAPLPQFIKSKTHCAKCGYPVMPPDPELYEYFERLLSEQSIPPQGILALKKNGNKGFFLEQLKNHGVGLLCRCSAAWCPFCVSPVTPSTCGICRSDMVIYR